MDPLVVIAKISSRTGGRWRRRRAAAPNREKVNETATQSLGYVGFHRHTAAVHTAASYYMVYLNQKCQVPAASRRERQFI